MYNPIPYYLNELQRVLNTLSLPKVLVFIAFTIMLFKLHDFIFSRVNNLYYLVFQNQRSQRGRLGRIILAILYLIIATDLTNRFFRTNFYTYSAFDSRVYLEWMFYYFMIFYAALVWLGTFNGFLGGDGMFINPIVLIILIVLGIYIYSRISKSGSSNPLGFNLNNRNSQIQRFRTSASDQDRTWALIVWGLYLASFFTIGITTIIGVIIAYVKRSDLSGSSMGSHMEYAISTFWTYFLWCLIGGALILAYGLGFIVLVAMGFWFLYRSIKGLIYAIEWKKIS